MVNGKLTGNTYIAPVVQQTLDRAMDLTKKKQTLGYVPSVSQQSTKSNIPTVPTLTHMHTTTTRCVGIESIGRMYNRFSCYSQALKFPGCKGTNLMEYPLLKKGGASGSPEADRIVYDAKGIFCGCMTHEGVQGNAFQLCKS